MTTPLASHKILLWPHLHLIPSFSLSGSHPGHSSTGVPLCTLPAGSPQPPQALPMPHPPRTCHADAGELAYAIEARGLVAAGPRQALIDICLTARASVATATLAQERTLCVHAPAQVLTRVGTCRNRHSWCGQLRTNVTPPSQLRKCLSPMEHSSTSWSHAPPVKPGGQVQIARPFTGFVSQIASS